MMLYYWDTSALLSLVFQEKQPVFLKQILSKKRGIPGYTSFFTFLEMESAISRRLLKGTVQENYLAEIRFQVQVIESIMALIWPDTSLLTSGKEIISRFGLKPGDALQLASCLALQQKGREVVFLCLDHKLNKAAQTHALKTI